MLSVPVQEDLQNYKEKLILGLSKRGLISVVGALFTTVLASVWLWLVFEINPSDFGFVLMVVSVPFWLVGFIKPSGMYFEDYFPKRMEVKFKKTYLLHESNATKDGYVDSSSRKKVTFMHNPRKLHGYEAYNPNRNE